MIRQFFKTSFRHLWKTRGHSFLNIFGLAIGLTCAGLIFLWVENELHFDQVHLKKDRLYFTLENQKYDAGVATFSSTPGVLGPALLSEIPGIANTCRVSEDNANLLFRIGERSLYAKGHFAEPSLFSMFTLPFVQGDASRAFTQPYSMVITQKTAHKFFGTETNVIGKTVRVDNKQDYVISGVVKDMPENSFIQFEWIAPFDIWYRQSPWAWVWGNNCLSTFVELKPGVEAASIDKQLYNFIQKRAPQSLARPFLFSMKDWHLRWQFDNGKQTGGGQIQYVHLFSLIAWIILLIACINFMNLATARSEKRAREVGVRKVLGAGKKRLVGQFISEALLLALVAAFFAVIFITLALPSFNLLVEKNLALGWNNPFHWAALLLITLVCGLVAGSYPALYLSAFNPVFVLKGIRIKSGSAAWVRKGLVLIQFTVSTILIIGTLTIFQQIQHVKNRDLGFNKENLLELPLQGEMAKHYGEIKYDLLQTGCVQSVALQDHNTLYGGNNTDGFTWEGKPPGAKILISWRGVSPEYMSTTGLKILEGRDFQPNDSMVSFKNKNVLITRAFAQMLGKGSALGKTIREEGDTSGGTYTVVGVVNNYVYGNMYGTPDPVFFECISATNSSGMFLRLKNNLHLEKDLASIEAVMKKDNPAFPFDYRFEDAQFNDLFQNEMLVSRLSRVFAALAILISCLGLFGLAAYTAERRTKEIGIRKVLGASVSGITALLSREFLQLVLLSWVLAFPIGWYAMNKWLADYQYRISIQWWVFAGAGALALLIALLTISFQTIRAALSNPVRNLRTE